MDAELRERVRIRANHRCEYCHIEERFFKQLFQIERIVARSHGGGDEPKNLALACRLFAGFRYFDVDWEKGSGRDRIGYDWQVYGPIVGVNIYF